MATTIDDIRGFLSSRGWKANPGKTKYFYDTHNYPHLHLDLKFATGKSKVLYWIKFFGFSATDKADNILIADESHYNGHAINSLATKYRDAALAIIDGVVK